MNPTNFENTDYIICPRCGGIIDIRVGDRFYNPMFDPDGPLFDSTNKEEALCPQCLYKMEANDD